MMYVQNFPCIWVACLQLLYGNGAGLIYQVSITTTTVLRLCGFCPGQPGSAGTRRNIHPLTPIVVINHPLSASSIYHDLWHPPCSTYVPDSLFAQSLSKFSLVYLLACIIREKFCWIIK